MNIDGRKLLSLHTILFFIRIVVALVMVNSRKMRRFSLSAGHQLEGRDTVKIDTGTEVIFRFSDNHPVKGTS
jgi:hypothetical protein